MDKREFTKEAKAQMKRQNEEFERRKKFYQILFNKDETKIWTLVNLFAILNTKIKGEFTEQGYT